MMYLLLRLTFIFGSLTLATVLSDTRTSWWTPHRHSSGTVVKTDGTTRLELELIRNNSAIDVTHRRKTHPSGAVFSDSVRTTTSTHNKAHPIKDHSSDKIILSNRTDSPCNQHGKCLGHTVRRHTAELEVPGTDSAPSLSRYTHLELRLMALVRPKRAAQDNKSKYKQTDKYGGQWHETTPSTPWEPLPKPIAQSSTDFPFDFTRNDGLFTEPPDHDLGDITPLIPLITRSRDNDVKNPFYPVTSETYGAYVVLIIAVIIFSFGILGNVTIMCIVCHNYYMRSISNSLLANLALWDFIIIFFCLPLVVFHELTKNWLLGEFSCKIIPYIEVASLGVTTFTLCALCIDRFRAATNVQMYYEMIENCTSTAAKLAVIWIGALLLALPELLIRQLEREEERESVTTGAEEEQLRPPSLPCERCVVRISTTLPDTLYVLGLTYDSARLWWYFGCYFCLPTLFTICCSLATAQKIRQAERATVRGNRKQIQLEGQMNCVVVALAIVYGFCTIPENVCNIVSAYMAAGVPRRALDILHLVSQLLLFCKSAVTPVLLLVLCRPFSRAFMDCCCCCCEELGPPRDRDRDGEGGGTPGSDGDNNEPIDCTTTDLELSPFSTIQRPREISTCLPVGARC
ncbi:hypothetical protein ACEWY4_010629 [Coilia grayii]|uniref:G-protein coupled receptors family 1 profile domain-containing protein n=1 Tax=Coilia grayii TaxID=363190 RepID=A0ABD1K2G2_9TELE